MITMNTRTQSLVRSLKRLGIEEQRPLWKRVAVDLEKPSRARRLVNVYKLDKYAREGDVIVVPGKVCGNGELTKSVTVAALSFSESAREKISRKGKVLSIQELMAQDPKGKRVRVFG